MKKLSQIFTLVFTTKFLTSIVCVLIAVLLMKGLSNTTTSIGQALSQLSRRGGFPTFRFSIELMRKAFFHNLSWANMSRWEGARREPRGVLLRIYQMRSN